MERRGARELRRRREAPVEPAERALIKRLCELPDEVAEAAARRAPHRLCAYAMAVAADFHAFYRDCQVVGAEGEGVEDSRLASACSPSGRSRGRSGCSGSRRPSGCELTPQSS